MRGEQIQRSLVKLNLQGHLFSEVRANKSRKPDDTAVGVNVGDHFHILCHCDNSQLMTFILPCLSTNHCEGQGITSKLALTGKSEGEGETSTLAD